MLGALGAIKTAPLAQILGAFFLLLHVRPQSRLLRTRGPAMQCLVVRLL